MEGVFRNVQLLQRFVVFRGKIKMYIILESIFHIICEQN